MNANGTFFVQTIPGTTVDQTPFTEITTTDGNGTIDGNRYRPRGDHGVCPSCGRCRKCGQPSDDGDGWRFVPAPLWPPPNTGDTSEKHWRMISSRRTDGMISARITGANA